LSKQIIFIAGAGRSGSTLLDITLGNIKNHFSLGELIFFVENGLINNEYCSCGSKVVDCEFWSKILMEWNKSRILTNEEFVNAQYSLLRNKKTLLNLYYCLFPKKKHADYLKDLKTLYSVIFEVSGMNILIDSSKNVQYINQLKRLPFKLKVIHLKRSFFGVLNSVKKTIKKDPKLGVEKELIPQSFTYALFIWLFDNLFAKLFSIGLEYKRVSYESFIENPSLELLKITKLTPDDKHLLKSRGPLKSKHLVAGNRLRMKDNIYILKTSKEKRKIK
jgi:hypothetical protein